MPSQHRSASAPDGPPHAPAVVKPFYCREWVFAKIAQLLDARQSDKMALSGVLICGEPGAGKTATCTEMVRNGPSARLLANRVLASHFVNGYEPDSQAVVTFVANIVNQLTERLDGFADKLRHSDAADWLDPLKIRHDPDEAFQRTVLFPLLEMDAPPKNLLLVVDSLDEPGCCSGASGAHDDDDDKSQTIAELLANHHHLFPPWLLLVVSLKRSNKALARLFTGFKKIALDQVKRSAVVRDVQQYILARLEREPGLRRHLTRETAPALNMLHIKSHGCLLYVEAVLDGVADGSVLLRDIPEIPGTLNGLYLWLCQRLFTRRGWNKVQPIIGCLLSARHPPTVDELYALSQTIDIKMTRSDFKKRMHTIRKLIVPAGGDGSARTIFHSSFGQWLMDVKHCTQRFLINLGDGHARWAVALAARSAELTPTQLDDLTFHLSRMTVESPLESWHLPLWLLWTKAPLPDRDVLEVMASSLGAVVDEQDQIEQQLVSPDPDADVQVDKEVVKVPDLPALSLAEETTTTTTTTSPAETEATVRRDSIHEEENDDEDVVQPAEETSVVERRNSIRYLRQRDHSLNDSDDPEQTLFYASQMGYCSAVQKLCTRYKSSISQSALRHALSIASRQGHANLVAVLIECGADPDAADSEGWTPLRAAAWAGHASTVRVLLERGAQVDASDAEGRTALRAAAWAGHEEVVRLLLNAGAQVDGEDMQGRTPLIAAAYMGHADIVSALLDAGARPDHVDCEGRTALSVAVLSVACRSTDDSSKKRRPVFSRRRSKQDEPIYENKQNGTLDGDDNEAVETVTILLEYGASVNHQDKEGMTPLLVAAFEGHRTVCELLLEAEADVDLSDVGGRTPLLAAASTGHGHIVELLLFWGCYVDSIDAEGRTVLSVAAAQGSVEVVRLLLDRGLDEAHRDNAGWTPLHYASLEGHASVVGILAEVGARLDATDNDGRAPLLLASQEGHLPVVEKLIQLGADVDQKSLDGKSPLRVAALEGHINVMTALVQAGADVAGRDADGRTVLYMLAIENKVAQAEIILKAGKYDMESDRDLEGRTPLHIAAWQGHTAMVELLLRHGADVNATDREQRTPLQSAAWQGHENVVWLLLKAGARSDQPCSQGATPLSIAAQEGHEGVARLLLAGGADPNRADGCGRTALKLAMKGGHKKVIQLLENWTATCAKSVSSNEAGSHRYLSAINGFDSSGKDYSPASTFDTASGKSGSNLTSSTPRSSSHIMVDAMSFTQQLQQQARGSRSRAAGFQLPLFQSSRILSPLSEPQSPLYASPPPPTPPEEQPLDIWQPIQQTPPLERHEILHEPIVTNGRSKSSLLRRERSDDTFNQRTNPPVPQRTSSVIDPDRIPISAIPITTDKLESTARPSSVPLTQSGHMQIILGLPSKTRRNGFGHHRPVSHQREHHHGGGLSGVLAGFRNSALMHGSTKLKNALCNAVSRPVGVISKKETQL